MRETITVNRIIVCSYIAKEVAQQISAYSLDQQDQEKASSELLTKYCSGEHSCKCSDCQFITGANGKIYSKSLESVLKCFEAMHNN